MTSGVTVGLVLECDSQVGRPSQQVQQRPQREALAAVPFQAEIDQRMLDPGFDALGRA